MTALQRSSGFRIRSVLVVGALALLLVTACGGSDEPNEASFADALGQVEDLRGKEREQALLKLAKTEGDQLSLYTSMTVEIADEVVSAFEDEYGLDVALYRADSETVLRRLVEEADAGFHGADVTDNGGEEMVELRRQELLESYRPPNLEGLAQGSIQDGWIANRFLKFVVSWNTKRVPSGDEPASWEDLADPRWRGKLALELDDYDWYKTLRDHWISAGKSEAEADRLFEQIARNGVALKGHPLMAQLLAAGEYDVAVSMFLHHTKGSIEDGAPVAWQPAVLPVVSKPQGVGLVKDLQHPAAAMLFADWMLGDDAQKLLTGFHHVPARTRHGSPAREEVVVDVEKIVEEQEEWADRYERLLQGSKSGDGQ